MPYYPFGQDDVVRNSIKAYPRNSFFIYGGVVYYNERPFQTGSLSDNPNGVLHVPPGFVSLYEINVDRPANELVYPFITKNGSLTAFKQYPRQSIILIFNTAMF